MRQAARQLLDGLQAMGGHWGRSDGVEGRHCACDLKLNYKEYGCKPDKMSPKLAMGQTENYKAVESSTFSTDLKASMIISFALCGSWFSISNAALRWLMCTNLQQARDSANTNLWPHSTFLISAISLCGGEIPKLCAQSSAVPMSTNM